MCQILRLIGALECTLLTENPVDQPIQISESKREKSEGGKHSYYSSRRIKQSRSWVLSDVIHGDIHGAEVRKMAFMPFQKSS